MAASKLQAGQDSGGAGDQRLTDEELLACYSPETCAQVMSIRGLREKFLKQAETTVRKISNPKMEAVKP